MSFRRKFLRAICAVTESYGEILEGWFDLVARFLMLVVSASKHHPFDVLQSELRLEKSARAPSQEQN